MKRKLINKKVIYIGDDPNYFSLQNTQFKIVATHLFSDGTENYDLQNKDGYLIQHCCHGCHFEFT